MRKLLFLLSMFLSLWLANTLSAAEILTAKTLPGSRMEGLNIVNFSVNSAVARDYYAHFWLIPPRHADNSYTVYQVFLNGNKVGEIRPEKGNWQNATIKGNPALSLREGDNIISIGTKVPELPQVESMRIVSSKSMEGFSSKAYNDYLQKSMKGFSYPVPPDADTMTKSTDMNADDVEDHGSFPLKYSFFSVFNFNEGDTIVISTKSSMEHDFDLVYYGSAEPPVVVGPGNTPVNKNEINDEVIGEIFRPEQKVNYIGTAATSAEKQGLNWKALSEPALVLGIGQSTPDQNAKMELEIPKSGHYLLRVRTRKNGTSSYADVNVNGEYFYSNVPISYSRKYILLEPDVNIVTYTKAEDSTNDPFLFIQGSDADRVVAYDDDTYNFTVLSKYNLSVTDAFIQEKYIVETTTISVLNYWSNAPEGSCNIYSVYKPITLLPETYTENTILDNSLKNDSSDSEPRSELEKTSIVSIFDWSGNFLHSVTLNASESFSPSKLGISQPGFYFLRIDSGSNVKTIKIRITSITL